MLEHDYLFPNAPKYDPTAHYDDVRHDSDIPLITPMLRMIDGITLGGDSDRALRDPTGPVTVPGITVPRPTDQPASDGGAAGGQ